MVQGRSRDPTRTLRNASIFGGAFLAGSTLAFAAAALLGDVLGVSDLPTRWRTGLGGTGLLLLAGADVAALMAATYCPLGWRRQTPRHLMRRHPVPLVLAVWGLDTGLVVTTFRVAALSWGAMALTGLGLCPWWVGAAYGLGFTLPFSVLLSTHRVGRASRERGPADPGLESMLRRRRPVQAVSAALLLVGGVALLAQAVP